MGRVNRPHNSPGQRVSLWPGRLLRVPVLVVQAAILLQSSQLQAAAPQAATAVSRQQSSPVAGFGHSPVPAARSTSRGSTAPRSPILRTSGHAPAGLPRRDQYLRPARSTELDFDWPENPQTDQLPAAAEEETATSKAAPAPNPADGSPTEETVPAGQGIRKLFATATRPWQALSARAPAAVPPLPDATAPQDAATPADSRPARRPLADQFPGHSHPGHSQPAQQPQAGPKADCRQCETRRLRRLFETDRGDNLLDRFGIHLDGWVEQGLTFNFDPPQNDSSLPGAGFNDAANEYMLNQLYFRLKKEPPTDRDVMGLGFQTDFLFGTDARFVTADGLDDSWAADHRYYRMAMPQAFLDLYLPAGPGIRLKVGRYYAVSDYETVPAPENFFYSHTYSLQYGQPLTLTGTLSSFRVSPSVDLNFGLHRGWDDFADEDNGSPGVLGAITWRNRSERFRLAAVWIVSEERQQLYSTTDGARAEADGTRFLQTLVATARLSQRLSAVWQATYGHQSDAAAIIDSTTVPVSTIRLQDAEWYGLTQYLFYDLSPQLSLGGRLEWFHDDDGTRVPDGQSLATGGLRTAGTVQSALSSGTFRSGGNYSALTLGCNWRPACGLTVRPELRFDWSDVSRNLPTNSSGPFHDLSSSSQITLGTDIIWLF